MRLDTKPPGGRPPLRTVTEIAETLGITHQQLSKALLREGAPQAVLRGSEVGHRVAGKNRVWYEPKEVIRWYRSAVLPDDPAEQRRKYFRDYYRDHYARKP